MEKLNFEDNTSFKTFIEWLDDYMSAMEETKLFSLKDKVFKTFGIRSNNFDLREITKEVNEDEPTEEELIEAFNSLFGEPEKIEHLTHEEVRERFGTKFNKKFQKEIDETVINEDFWIFFRYEQEIEKIKDTLDSMIFGIVMNMEIKISHLLKNNRLKTTARIAEGEVIGNSNIYISHDNINGVKFKLVEDLDTNDEKK